MQMTSLSTPVAVSTSISVASVSISSITRISIGAVSQTVSTIASVSKPISVVGISISLWLSLGLSLADVVAAVSKTAVSIGTSSVSQTVSTIEARVSQTISTIKSSVSQTISGVSKTVSTIAPVAKAIASPAIVGISISLGLSQGTAHQGEDNQELHTAASSF